MLDFMFNTYWSVLLTGHSSLEYYYSAAICSPFPPPILGYQTTPEDSERFRQTNSSSRVSIDTS